MPRLSINWSNTIIYKIVCNDVNIKDCYVGATTNFIKRKNNHKHKCNDLNNNTYNLKIYSFIRDNGNWNNWSMIMIEKYPCNNQLESDIRERYWLETLGATLNSIIPSQTDKEYYEINKEVILKWHKEYRETNKKIIKEKKKEDYQKHKQEILKKQKEFYQQNKEKILEKQKEKNTCDCGIIYNKNDKSKHLKTQKHKLFVGLE